MIGPAPRRSAPPTRWPAAAVVVGTTSVTRPMRSARPASTTSPVIDSRRAIAGPTTCGSRAVMPPPGRMPTRAWVSANTARSEAMRKSQPSAISRPPVNVAPLIGADDRRAHLARSGVMQLCDLELLEVLQPESLRLLEVDAGAERRVGAGQHHGAHGRSSSASRQRGVRAPRSGPGSTHFAPPAGSASAPGPRRGRRPRTSDRTVMRRNCAACDESSSGCGKHAEGDRDRRGDRDGRVLKMLGTTTCTGSAGGSVKNISTITRT